MRVDFPKPMVKIGYRPILWHLMKYYAHFGHKDFILCLGYRANSVKEYFLNYDESVSNDFTLVKGGKKICLSQRHRRLEHHLRRHRVSMPASGRGSKQSESIPERRGEYFLANYGDGLTDLPLPDMIKAFKTAAPSAASA